MISIVEFIYSTVGLEVMQNIWFVEFGLKLV